MLGRKKIYFEMFIFDFGAKMDLSTFMRKCMQLNTRLQNEALSNARLCNTGYVVHAATDPVVCFLVRAGLVLEE